MRGTWHALTAILVSGLLAAAGNGTAERHDVTPRLPASAPPKPNILLVILDDVGTDLLPLGGGEAPASVCTPSIDQLAENGVVFESAWAAPTCSPTRAQIMTGRHGFRTGIGTWISSDPGHRNGLDPAETTLAERVSSVGYSTGLFGKWHLATENLPTDDPLRHGFDWFDGSIAGQLDPEGPCPGCPPGCRERGLGYRRWVRSSNGRETCETRYATSSTVDEALAAIASAPLPEPWFVATSFNAVHSPFHRPPSTLCSGDPSCACSGPLSSAGEKARAALEALDTEVYRLISTLSSGSARRLVVILVGDNGSAPPVTTGQVGGCNDPARSKGTLYEGGVHVPLVVWSPGLSEARIAAPVSATDLFATIADLAGVTSEAEDSISLLPYLEGFRGSLRTSAYSESFEPNGLPFRPSNHERAIRERRYKLIRRDAGADELYDLETDPCEARDLFPPASASEAGRAWERLDSELRAMGVG